jgi:hypothetical protein
MNSTRIRARSEMSRVNLIFLLALGMLLVLPEASRAEQSASIAERIAKTYGLDSFGQIKAIRHVAMLYNAGDLSMTRRYRESRAAAGALGLTVQPLPVSESEGFDEAFEAMTREPPGGLFMVTDALTFLNRRRVFDFAAEHRLPAIYEFGSLVRDGGLMSYGNELFEVSPIGPFARTSNVRAPSSGGIGSSHGAAIIVSCASERPCDHRVSIVGRSNS